MGLRSNRRLGAASIEFAAVAPILFLSCMAGVEFVRANVIRHTAQNASYTACRAVIVPGATKQEAMDKANAVLALAGIQGAKISFEPSRIDEESIFVATTIATPMNKNSWGISMFFQGSELVTSTTLRTERAPHVQNQALPTIVNPPPPPPPEPEPTPEPIPVPNPTPSPEPVPEPTPTPTPPPEPTPTPPPVLL